MDKGAHFHQCDFQVHTPRDRRWVGQEFITDEERKNYSQALIKACRDKKIQAIAITDHHDMFFAKYIRQEAIEETDENGLLIPEQERIIVFPGIELTLSVPCQAIIIFDADFPDDMFSLVLTALAITVSDPTDSRTIKTIRQPIRTIMEIKENLDKHEYLRGKYIIFPNLSESGNSTLLRSGFAAEYKSMPCVGGYVDGDLSQHGRGNTEIIEGRNKEYGNKKIAIFQTSDNRREDHADLGKNTTWVKWAKPTAEALRQACLADKSRLTQKFPHLPQSYITEISVSNSKFLGPLNLKFNRQLNTLIGGRGTGKSSILEYLRWALCDENPISMNDDETIDYQSKREKLIKNTLLDLKSNIQVGFIKNDVKHTVRRFDSGNDLLLKIGEGEFEKATIEQICSILPIQSYSQKQLSSVSVKKEQLLHFIQKPVQEKINRIDRDRKDLEQKIRQAYGNRERLKTLNKDKEKITKDITSLLEQSENLKKKITGLLKDDDITIRQKSSIDREKLICQQWKDDLGSINNSISELAFKFSNHPKDVESVELVNKELVNSLLSDLILAYKKSKQAIDSASNILEQVLKSDSTITEKFKKINDAHDIFDQSYIQAKERSAIHQSTLTEIESIDEKIKVLQLERSSIETKLEPLKMAGDQFDELFDQWFEHGEYINKILLEQCNELTTLSDGMIRATLLTNNNFSNVLEVFQGVIKGSNVRISKVEDIVSSVRESDNIFEKWRYVLRELESIISYEGVKSESEYSKLINLKSYFSNQDIQKVSNKIKPQDWINIALTPIESFPKFEYKSREQEYIPFEDASAGQQATALLWVLLNQGGPPLIIDQPEDDLDSQIIIKIVEQIWKAKLNRQLIFSSHNANLVVNGDAELVVCCDYRTAGEQSSGHIKIEGAIDIPEVREEITKVMEGGQEAFKLRKDKYGF
ncbi:hypothetical protein BN873_370002 [Candidatus Competibacter denitrificans Run_A_D11]|uniref:Uncharacterized protein n=1 Tax=Candidatus Competibacter denitrificans Run_A_D11 TaxID=1400863 RepID=W6MDK1_9GAMM|nr:AAA family ATPase [Candidatus Competibacter denitrificans]CDI03003.1 hypothetical protein BN873_370002 [Candidatus Competibacter denitrificans Run_A_D11]